MGTDKEAKADYAIACNFNLRLDCNNYKKLHPNNIEVGKDFKKMALDRLYSLVLDSYKSYEKGETLPILFEVYDADLQLNPETDSMSDPENKKS